MRVLLIEDNADDARLVAELLNVRSEIGFKLTVCETLGGGMAELAAGQFDVVISDLNLPDSSGLAGIETLAVVNAAVPIIVLTGNSDETLGIQALQKGAADYLVKGQVTANLISRSIRYAIERKYETIKLIEASRIADERATALKDLTDDLENIVEQRTCQLLKASAELERSRRMADVGRLASTISHELRNPLAAIKLAAYNLQRKTNDPSLIPHLNNINKKINEGDTIIQNLLSFAHTRTDNFENVVLNTLLEECIANVHGKYQSHQTVLKKDVGVGSHDTIEADPVQLRIMLSNIIDNAFQSLPDQKGTVSVAAGIMGPSYIISISDTGVGIEPENIDKVYEPFYTTKSKGTGLGLAVCKDIIESHHGAIELRSEPHKGTTFIVTLPVRQPKDQKHLLKSE